MARAAPSLGTRRPSPMAGRDGDNCPYKAGTRIRSLRRPARGQGRATRGAQSARDPTDPWGSVSGVTRGRLRHGTLLWVSPSTPAKGATRPPKLPPAAPGRLGPGDAVASTALGRPRGTGQSHPRGHQGRLSDLDSRVGDPRSGIHP